MASTIYNKNNMSTADVKKMQKALIKAGYDVGSTGADGIWGANTEKALSQYKKDTGGSNTYGTTVGNETFRKLYGTGSSGNKNKPNTTGGMIGTGVTSLPGMGTETFQTNLVTPDMYAYANSANNAYTNSLNSLKEGYGKYIDTLQDGTKNANAALEEARTNALASIKQTYDDSARNYYRLYRTQENELPEQLSSIGATGGATETAALNLMNNYSNNLYNNETARNKDTNTLNENYHNAVAQNSIQLAGQIADAYLNMALQQQEIENANYQNQQDLLAMYQQYQLDAEEKAAAAAVNKWNSNVTNRMEEQLAKGDTIWTWTDDDGKMHWTTYESKGLANGGKKLSTSSSTSKTSKKKVNNSSSSGSSSKKSSGGSSSSSKKKSTTGGADYNTVKAQAQLRIANTNALSGIKQSKGNDAVGAVNYIENSKLTKSQKNKLYKELGLA
jgi:hypothetical protein